MLHSARFISSCGTLANALQRSNAQQVPLGLVDLASILPILSAAAFHTVEEASANKVDESSYLMLLKIPVLNEDHASA